MSDGRRTPALLLLAVGALLAAASLWVLEVARRSASPSQPESARTTPDQYAENFRFLRISALGDAAYVVRGRRLLHYPADDSSVIEEPTVRAYSAQRDPMTVVARRAVANKDQSEVRLYDDVKLERPQTRRGETLTVKSEYMLVLPKEDMVKTDHPVEMRLGKSTLRGTGMVADNAKRQLTLLSRVSAEFVRKP